MSIETPFPVARYSFRKGSWQWIKREKWWLVFLVVCLFVMVSFSATTPLFIGALLALTTGGTRKSRIFMILCGLVISIPPIIAMAIYVA